MRLLVLMALLLAAPVQAQRAETHRVTSPDGRLELALTVGADLRWSVTHDGTPVVAASPLALTLQGGEVLGARPRVRTTRPASVDATITPVAYKKAAIRDHYNQLTVHFQGGYGVVLRAYDDGVAYRFVLDRADSVTVASETAHFAFAGDYTAHVPFIRDLRANDPFMSAQEAHYDVQPLSAIPADTLAYSPALVELPGGRKAVVLEADLEAYPGLFLRPLAASPGFQGVFAPFPLREERLERNLIVPERAPYIARVAGNRVLPWRAVAVSARDADLLNSDLVYKLAAPSRIEDPSWIRPGKVAWDWWNDWNIRGVDFRSGINTETYRHYIDFAAENRLEYIIMDEGWSVPGDLMTVVPELDLPGLIAYARERGVDLILWANWWQTRGQEDVLFPHYAALGIKGFKVDFFDRDDQPAVASVYHTAERAAAYRLLLDLHGIYKPTGLQRTYPNVVNFEGVKGLENVKWTPVDDVPRYDVTAPYVRMLVGPMDYTPGAMRNATRHDFRASHSTPMSHGTRTHQLAMYTVFEAPLQMLADNPSNYRDEQESTDFIARVPTVFDETVALDGAVGEYLALARRRGNTWFVGAMTNWTPRDLTLDLSFLGPGAYEAVIFQDGVNAHRDARDYKRVVRRVTATDRLDVHLSEGGGWTARLTPVR